MPTREVQLQALQQSTDWPVVIAGGGINGIGLFYDLSLQGIDCLLVEQGDFMAGASSAPSRMIHGGLRYLETGDLALVREGVRERDRLLVNAPHLVRPLPTTVPVYSRFGGLTQPLWRALGRSVATRHRGWLALKAGLSLYEGFSRNPQLPRHDMLSRDQALQQYPGLDPGIIAAARYTDACISQPEWLAFELLAAAGQANPAGLALNYLQLSGRDGRELLLRDAHSGASYTVRCQLLVNATGAWVDRTQNTLDAGAASLVSGSKGSHLVLDHPALCQALNGDMLFFEDGAGRICLMYPYHQRVLLGTTDIPVSDPDSVRCEAEEEAYLLAAAGRLWPGFTVGPEHVVFRFSGVRPLAFSGEAHSGAISRAHRLHEASLGELPVLAMVGGKWTSYRAFAEQAADRVLHYLGRERRCSTAEKVIGGGRDYPGSPAASEQWLAALAAETGYPHARLQSLLQRYGTGARVVAHHCRQCQGDRPLQYCPDYSSGEIDFLVRQTGVQRLDDLLLRRTLLAIRGQLSRPLIDELAAILAGILHWTPAQQTQASADCLDLLADRHGVDLR